MLTDSIRSCISTIKQKQEVLKNKQSFEDYQKTLASLSLECQGVAASLDTIDSINSHKISNVSILDSETKSALLESIDQCGIGLENGQLSKETVQEFGIHAKQLQRDLSASWKTCSTQFSEGATGYLGIILGLTEKPSEVESLRSRIISLLNSEPSADSAEKLFSDVTQANAIISRFSLKPEIEEFLKKVASKQASVADLSPEVVGWLKQQNLLKKLRVSF